jgi:SH3-like domain-containing protein
VHYSLLSGTRSILVTAAMLDLHSVPLPDAPVVLRAEAGVIGRVLECKPDWCRLNINGEKGWAPKTDFWGVDPEESFE